jgi:hypothetical protein
MERTRKDKVLGTLVGMCVALILGTMLPAAVTKYILPFSYFVQVDDISARWEGGVVDLSEESRRAGWNLEVTIDRWVREDMPVVVTASIFKKNDGMVPIVTVTDRRILRKGSLVYEMPVADVPCLEAGIYEVVVMFEVDVGSGVTRRNSWLLDLVVLE